jgi:hypothetical protein
MSIQTSKIELVKMILSIENAEFISKISEFVKQESVDFWSTLSASEKQEIQKGIEQLDNGQRIDFNDFLKKIS